MALPKDVEGLAWPAGVEPRFEHWFAQIRAHLADLYSQIGTGSTTLTGLFDVTASPYEAEGDGVADDTTAIQAAIDAAEAANGGIVYFPPGLTFLVSEASEEDYCLIVDDSNVILWGYGATITETEGSTRVIEVSSASHFACLGLNFQGPNSDGTDLTDAGLYVVSSTSPLVRDVRMEDLDADGISMTSCTNILITDCELSNISRRSISLTSCTDALVKGCVIESGGGHTQSSSTVGTGIHLAGCTDAVCTSCLISGITGMGVYCTDNGSNGPKRNKIHDNVIHGCANATNLAHSSAIRCDNATASLDCGTLITGNICEANSIYNIYIAGHNGSLVTFNTVIESGRSNIVVSTITGCTVKQNEVINTNTSNTAGSAGVLLAGSADSVLVFGNRTYESAHFATSFGDHAVVDNSAGTNRVLPNIQVTISTSTPSGTPQDGDLWGVYTP